MNRNDATFDIRRSRGGMLRGAGMARLVLPPSLGGID
jgi:hypothetical protein